MTPMPVLRAAGGRGHVLSEGASVRRRALALLASRAFSGIELAARKKFWREAPLLDPPLPSTSRAVKRFRRCQGDFFS